ncbi:MAG: MFS transporter [Oscillospiraceae bacterium]|jgi:fucose permease|nr:MFS transporter [Oscillospiraceae bacterium]
MAALLIVIIYIAFISLGLPDSLLGSAWPVMQPLMGVPLSYAGIVSMIISACTVTASLLSDRLTRKLGTGLVTALSVALTAAALFGFSASWSFWLLCLFAVPYGLGAGAIDAALNNYVALHYAARHMNWLHCCWGLGASVSPYVMGHFLTNGLNWNGGYGAIALIQAILAAALFFTLPLWRKRQTGPVGKDSSAPPLTLPQILRVKGVKFVLPAFFSYCAVEMTAILWAATYLVNARGVDSVTAARYASFFFFGITAGRFICGFLSSKIGNYTMIRIGGSVMLAGIAAVFLPVGTAWVSLYGLIIIGLGCAPVYPAIIHQTPINFGADKSQAIIGVQMASAYTGSTLMPPLFGLLAGRFGLELFPWFMLILTVLMLFMIEALKKTVRVI